MKTVVQNAKYMRYYKSALLCLFGYFCTVLFCTIFLPEMSVFAYRVVEVIFMTPLFISLIIGRYKAIKNPR